MNAIEMQANLNLNITKQDVQSPFNPFSPLGRKQNCSYNIFTEEIFWHVVKILGEGLRGGTGTPWFNCDQYS